MQFDSPPILFYNAYVTLLWRTLTAEGKSMVTTGNQIPMAPLLPKRIELALPDVLKTQGFTGYAYIPRERVYEISAVHSNPQNDPLWTAIQTRDFRVYVPVDALETRLFASENYAAKIPGDLWETGVERNRTIEVTWLAATTGIVQVIVASPQFGSLSYGSGCGLEIPDSKDWTGDRKWYYSGKFRKWSTGSESIAWFTQVEPGTYRMIGVGHSYQPLLEVKAGEVTVLQVPDETGQVVLEERNELRR